MCPVYRGVSEDDAQCALRGSSWMEAGGEHSQIFGNSLYLTFVQSSSTVALGEVRWLLLWTNRNGARVKKN